MTCLDNYTLEQLQAFKVERSSQAAKIKAELANPGKVPLTNRNMYETVRKAV